MTRKIGTIEDVVALAKSRYQNVEDQVKYIQIAIDLITRDHSDEMKSINTLHEGYDYHITGFISSGNAYFWYNIYRGTQRIASKLEVVNNDSTIVLFSSSSEFSSPTTPLFRKYPHEH